MIQRSPTIRPIQARLLAFLYNRINISRISPTQAEMAIAIGVKTPPGALYHLKRLEALGFISRGKRGTHHNVTVIRLPVGLSAYSLRRTKPDPALVHTLGERLRTVYRQPGNDWDDVARAAMGFLNRKGKS